MINSTSNQTRTRSAAAGQASGKVASSNSRLAAEKKSVQKLQRAIVDGLENVKGQDIVVFDTERLSPLFERVIIASGTSNRQTKALALSVVDAVRDAGFAKPRVEGDGNGEWIIVDCGQVVLHVMQPNYRTYYNLEELWGEKPVRLKLGAAKPLAALARKALVAGAPARKPVPTLKRSSAAKKALAQVFPSQAAIKKALAGKAPASNQVAAKASRLKRPGDVDETSARKPQRQAQVDHVVRKTLAKKPANSRQELGESTQLKSKLATQSVPRRRATSNSAVKV